jgi:hypothetical protein
MTGILAYLDDPDYTPQPDLTPEEIRAAQEESVRSGIEFNKWLDSIVQKERGSAIDAAIADQRLANERVMEEIIEGMLADQLAAEHEKTWPSDGVRAEYVADFEKFKTWARERGVGYLPATGHVVARYLIESMIAEDAGLRVVKRVGRSIAFAHDLAEKYLNPLPISAAVQFCQAVDAEMAKLEEESTPAEEATSQT